MTIKKNILMLLAICICSSLGAQMHAVQNSETMYASDGSTMVKKGTALHRGIIPPKTNVPQSIAQRISNANAEDEGLSTEGQNFWATFMNNYNYDGVTSKTVTTQLIIAASENTTVTVTNPQTKWSTQANITGGNIATINIPLAQAYTYSTNVVCNTGINISSTKDISLYSSNHANNTYDAANIYPTKNLGTQYIVQCFGFSNFYATEFEVVATEDNTLVTIIPSVTTDKGQLAKQEFKVELNKGQTYQVTSGLTSYEDMNMTQNAKDLTGSVVVSNKPIAVFQGDARCFIPSNQYAGDHIYEQAIPVNAWGTDYIISGSTNMYTDHAIILASLDQTQVYVDGSLLYTLNTGEYCMIGFYSSTAKYIHATNPVSCCQYIDGCTTNSSNLGDPSMITMMPIEQRIDNIIFGTFQTSLTQNHYINIVAHDTVVNSVKLDGNYISSKFTNVPGNTEYNVARMSIGHATHSIESKGGVIAHVYGLGQAESYAYNVGGRMRSINNINIGGVTRDSIITDLHICTTDIPYTTGNLKIEKPGHYVDSTLQGNHTSIYIYDVTIHNPFDSVKVDTISQNKPSVEWLGKTYNQAGYHKYCASKASNCDSCYTLRLFAEHEVYDTTCNMGTYTFSGFTRNFTFTIPALGTEMQKDWDYSITDSLHIFNLHLHLVSPNLFYREFRDTICYGDQYIINGKTYKESGIYSFNVPTRYGCDSTIVFYLTVLPKKVKNITAYLCKGDYYQFGNQRITSAGQYTRVVRSEDGYNCDSTITLNLIAREKYLIVDTMSVCPRSPFKWRGTIYQKPGTYYDSLLSVSGCDSVFKLIAQAIPTRYGKDTAYFCPGDTVKVHGRYFWYETSFNDTLTSSLNCDSVRTTYIKKRPNFHKTATADICQGDWYPWRGFQYNEAGTYYDRFENQYGCDSIYELKLNVHPEYVMEEHAELCFGSKYSWRGKTYTKQGIYYDKLKTKSGCDSIYKLILTTVPTHLIQDTIDICQGSYAEFHGHRWTTAGLHYDSLKTTACGCDSVYQVLVRVHPIQTTKEEYITDEGKPFYWHGYEYDLDGTYVDTIKSSWGCDSICTLSLHICRAITSMEEASICSHDKYYWRGQYYNENGTFYSKKTGKNGCDSTFMLKLHVTPTDYITTKDSVCDQNYFWHNMEMTRTGFYTDTIYDPINNKCIVGQLDLKVKKTTIPTDVTILPACNDDSHFEISYTYQGDEPVRYSIIFDTNAQNHGFRNVIDSTINGPVIANIPHYINGEYLRPDIYHADFILENGVCDGYQKKHPIDIIIRYPSSILQQNWNDVVAVLNEKLNGGYEFSQYAWFVNNHAVEGNKSYLYQPDSWQPGDQVWASLTRVGESYSIPTCPITIEPYEETRVYPVDISYANASQARKMVKITSKESGYYSLYDLRGILLYHGEIGPTQATTLYLQDKNAVYILQVQTSESKTMVTKKIAF